MPLIKIIISRNVELLPIFFQSLPSILIATIILTSFGFIFFKKKQLNAFTAIISFYLGTSLLVLLFSVSFFILPNPILISKFLIAGIILISGLQLYLKRKKLALIVKQFLKNKIQLIMSLLVIFLITMLLHNFTFKNGLHDEYFHHSVLTTFFQTNNQSFQYNDVQINKSYHVGLYYLVIALKISLKIPIEQALDLSKLVLIMPSPILIYVFLRKYFKLDFLKSWLTTLAALFSGPSLFLLDQYTRNFFNHLSNPLLQQSIFFDLAGLTWHGLLFSIVFILFWWLVFKNKIKLSGLQIIVFLLISITSLYLINRLFFGVYIVNLSLLGFLKLSKKGFLKNRFLIPYALLFLLMVAFIYAQFFSHQRIDLGSKFYIRSGNNWGFPFQNQDTIDFFKITDLRGILKQFGLIWLWSLLLIIVNLIKRKKQSLVYLFLINILFFPFLCYFLGFLSQGSSLALNKLLRLGYFFEIIAISYYGYIVSENKTVRLFTTLLLIFSLTPILYFSSVDLSGLQRPWIE